MSKTQNLIDAMFATGDTTQVERQLAKPAITEWSRGKLSAALAQVKTTTTPVVESAKLPATADVDKFRKLHTKARKAAAEVKRAYWNANGKNLTYAEACAHMGTAPAKSGSDMLTKRPEHSQKFYAQVIADPASYLPA